MTMYASGAFGVTIETITQGNNIIGSSAGRMAMVVRMFADGNGFDKGDRGGMGAFGVTTETEDIGYTGRDHADCGTSVNADVVAGQNTKKTHKNKSR